MTATALLVGGLAIVAGMVAVMIRLERAQTWTDRTST